MLRAGLRGRRRLISTHGLELAVGTGIVVIAVAVAVVLVVLFVTLSMRGRQRRAAERRRDELGPAGEASERTERQRTRDIARDEREDAAGEP